MKTSIRRAFVPALLALVLSLLSVPAAAQDAPEPLGVAMEGYAYPHPVSFLPLRIEGQDLRMAYMDVAPEGAANGRAVLLCHGKNFFGAYWKDTIAALLQQGYRVVVPDQIGFGKSSKPDIHYSFHLLAANTRELLDVLKLDRVAVVGHSMGGMVATRFALLYPERTSHLILENPIGLEDYRPIVPYSSLTETYERNLKSTLESLRAYQKSYYVEWKPEYDEYVQVQYRWTLSGEYPRIAWSAALTEAMIYQEPVCYEFPFIQAPALVVIGQEDRTVVGKNRVPKDRLGEVGQYPELGRRTAAAIPNAKLVELPNVGHIPHFEAPGAFHEALLAFLNPAG